MTATVALFQVATKRRSSALFNRTHGPELNSRQMVGLPLPVMFAVGAKDVGHLQRWPIHYSLG
jgi:hypothetical protein